MGKNRFLAASLFALIGVAAVSAYYIYSFNNEKNALADNAYREYKWNYVSEMSDGLNLTLYFMESEPQRALFYLDNALSTFKGSWVAQSMSSISNNYNTLFNAAINNTLIFGEGTGSIYSTLFNIRVSIFYSNTTQEQKDFLSNASSTYQYFPDSLSEPQGNVYSISNLNTVITKLYTLSEIARELNRA